MLSIHSWAFTLSWAQKLYTRLVVLSWKTTGGDDDSMFERHQLCYCSVSIWFLSVTEHNICILRENIPAWSAVRTKWHIWRVKACNLNKVNSHQRRLSHRCSSAPPWQAFLEWPTPLRPAQWPLCTPCPAGSRSISAGAVKRQTPLETRILFFFLLGRNFMLLGSISSTHLMFGLVQHKPPWFPWFQQGPFLEQNAFKTPDERRAK